MLPQIVMIMTFEWNVKQSRLSGVIAVSVAE